MFGGEQAVAPFAPIHDSESALQQVEQTAEGNAGHTKQRVVNASMKIVVLVITMPKVSRVPNLKKMRRSQALKLELVVNAVRVRRHGEEQQQDVVTTVESVVIRFLQPREVVPTAVIET